MSFGDPRSFKTKTATLRVHSRSFKTPRVPGGTLWIFIIETRKENRHKTLKSSTLNPPPRWDKLPGPLFEPLQKFSSAYTLPTPDALLSCAPFPPNIGFVRPTPK